MNMILAHSNAPETMGIELGNFLGPYAELVKKAGVAVTKFKCYECASGTFVVSQFSARVSMKCGGPLHGSIISAISCIMSHLPFHNSYFSDLGGFMVQ